MERTGIIDKSLGSMPEQSYMLVAPIRSALKKLGLNKLAQKLESHYALHESNAAGLNSFIRNSKKILGFGIGKKKKLQQIQDDLWAIRDNGETLIKSLEYLNKKIDRKDKKRIRSAKVFFDKAIKKEWWNTVKKNKDGEFKSADGLLKYINTNTKEGKILEQYVIHVVEPLGRAKYEASLKTSLSEAEYEVAIKKSDIKFSDEKGEIYYHRALTEDGRRLLNIDAKAQRNAIEKIAKEIAIEEAMKKYGKNYDESKIMEGKEGSTIWDDAYILAKERFLDQVHFNPSKMTTKYLKKKFALQDLYMENENGKLIRTYEIDFEANVIPMVDGLSRFYATMALFPEAIQGLKKGNSIEKVFRQLEKGAVGKEAKNVNWAKDVIRKQLGIEKSAEPYEFAFRSLETAARVVAKTGLSFPTAGLAKNIMTGSTSTLFQDRFIDIARGLANVISKDGEAYNRALSSNAYRIGNVMYEGRTVFDKFLTRWAFRFGFMEPTEIFNRLLNVATSKYDVSRQFERLRIYPKEHRHYRSAMDRLKTRYSITEKEILKKIKYETKNEIMVDKNLSEYQKAQEIINLEMIDNKINVYAHVNAQGSSADLFMPKKAGGEWIRPLTLFKRMAYAQTDNTQRSLRFAGREIKRGQITGVIMPMMGFTATYFTGRAMMGIYSSLLGTSPPKENSDWWTRFKTTMWKGEFLGILSEVISPFDTGFSQTLEPAIYNTATSMFLETKQLIEGTSNLGQWGSNMMKNHFSLWGNTYKIINRRNNPLSRDEIRFKKLERDYQEENGIVFPEEYTKSTRSPYYKDLKTYFFKGNEEEFAKQLYTTLFYVAHEYVRQGWSVDVAFKKAKQGINTSLKSMNPNVASMYKTSKEGKYQSMLFRQWLSKHKDADYLLARLDEVEIEYMQRMQKYTSMLPHYAKKFNVADMAKKYDWTFK